MNIQLYAGEVLVYDSRLPAESGLSMLGIRTEESLGAGGVARLTFPPAHPQADRLRPFSVPVEIYTDGKLRWRGRPLPPSEDHYLRRTIVCEGELCFFQDSTHRPHVYQAIAKEVFASLVAVHNGSIEPWKRFAVGNVSADFEKISVTLELDKAKTVYEALMQLVKQCGGYFFFDSSPEGERRVNWYAYMPYICNQKITVDSNLLKYSSSYDVSEFATRLVPYGAKGEDGVRLQLDDNGKDYVENAAAVELRGIVEKPVVYDDITTQDALRDRAQADVDLRCLLPRIIQLSAVDMARYNLALDHFSVGQLVPAESAFHDLSGSYGIIKLVVDYLNPKSSSVTLSRETVSMQGGNAYTLTHALVSGQKSILDQANEYANGAAQSAVSAQSQKYIFDKLTNGGTMEGVFMEDDDIYINASYIKTGIIDASQVTVENLDASKIVTGIIDASKIDVKNINASKISTGTIDASKISVKNINASNITTGTLSAALLKSGKITNGDSYFDLDSGTFYCKGSSSSLALSGGVLNLRNSAGTLCAKVSVSQNGGALYLYNGSGQETLRLVATSQGLGLGLKDTESGSFVAGFVGYGTINGVRTIVAF